MYQELTNYDNKIIKELSDPNSYSDEFIEEIEEELNKQEEQAKRNIYLTQDRTCKCTGKCNGGGKSAL